MEPKTFYQYLKAEMEAGHTVFVFEINKSEASSEIEIKIGACAGDQKIGMVDQGRKFVTSGAGSNYIKMKK